MWRQSGPCWLFIRGSWEVLSFITQPSRYARMNNLRGSYGQCLIFSKWTVIVERIPISFATSVKAFKPATIKAQVRQQTASPQRLELPNLDERASARQENLISS